MTIELGTWMIPAVITVLAIAYLYIEEMTGCFDECRKWHVITISETFWLIWLVSELY